MAAAKILEAIESAQIDEEDESEGSSDEEYQDCMCVDDTNKKAKIIPYKTVYETQDICRDRGYFIPGLPVKANIVNAERDTGTLHLFNPYVYTIELEHGPFQWTVQKRYKEFNHLHNRLLMFRAAQKMKAPVRRVEHSLRYHEGNDTDRTEGEDQVDSSKTVENSEQTDANGNATNNLTQDSPKSDEGEEEVHHHGGKRCTKACRLPRFPLWPDSIVASDNLDERRATLEKYLQAVLHITAYRNHHETAEFLEACRYSFVHNLGGKYKESLVKKRPGGRRIFIGWKHWCAVHCAKWSKKWLVVKDSCVLYIDPDDEEIRSIILYDSDFHVKAGAAETEGVRHGLLICNLQRYTVFWKHWLLGYCISGCKTRECRVCIGRNLLLKCQSDRAAEEWRQEIEKVVLRGAGKIWLQDNRFGSSFPVREPSYAQWFVDGRTFMEHAANMMELAQEEILITDWWLSPEVQMKRPMTEGNRWRLDQLLKRKAEQGVKIFVLLYKEVEMALGINSMYTKRKLQELHENVKVLRHPDHAAVGSSTLFWAHHEKLICIDQNIAFVGGIDLCYGRWDDYNHKLTDEGSVQFHTQHSLEHGQRSMMSGMRQLAAASVLPVNEETDKEVAQISEDAAIKAQEEEAKPAKQVDFADAPPEVSAPPKSSAEPKKLRFRALANKVVKRTVSEQPREKDSYDPYPAWRSTDGKMDLVSIVQQYKKMVDSGRIEELKRRGGTPPPERKKTQMGAALSKWKDTRLRRRWRQTVSEEEKEYKGYEIGWLKLQAGEDDVDSSLEGQSKLWIGKDYVNFIFKDFTDLDMPFHDFIDRGATPRMPWHDIHSVAYGAAARDVARHFIQRWNATKTEKFKEDGTYPYLVPKSYKNVQVPRVFRNFATRCQVQVLRSASSWSSGMNALEDSIQRAYLHMIANAEHYIYIENQFFVTICDSSDIFNEICKALCNRIERAHKEGQKFRVYVMLPLMPGFEGQLGATGGSALQAVLHWTYMSISRGSHSLYGTLARMNITNPEEYIVFCGLRTHDVLSNRLITELIYIHSKLMIVDDRCVLIGSANINDRSQLGKRDSEVALYFEDIDFVSSTMNGKPFEAGKFASSMRQFLFKEHLGILCENKDERKTPIDVTDPVCDEFYNDVWLKNSQVNTDVYEKVFRCIPTDSVKSFEELASYQNQIPMAEYMKAQAKEEIAKIRGYIVRFPCDFLCNSDLAPSITTKEGLAPASIFT